MFLNSEPVELRGIAHKVKKDGTFFYNVNVETEDGTPYSFYCPNDKAFGDGLKKGEKVVLTFEYNDFSKRIFLSRVELAK